MTIELTPAIDRWAQDTERRFKLDHYYNAYPHQQKFHGDSHKYRLFGGAAGPGKSTAGLFELVMSANEHEDGRKVTTLGLRRTVPELERSLILRFRQMVPPDMYRTYNEQKKLVTWWNGATTLFASVPHKESIWDFQGSEFKDVYWDELTQFVLPYHWTTLSAWNRCAIAPAGMCGGTNPVGVGAIFVKKACVDKKLPPGMEPHQYDARDYGFTPALITDNPTYATDETYLSTLRRLPARLREALLAGRWDVALGAYFDIFDPVAHTYPSSSVHIPYWCPRWLGIDWGYEHPAACMWHATDERGIHRTYRELVTHKSGRPKMPPRQLAESIVTESMMLVPTIIDEHEQITAEPEVPKKIFLGQDAFADRGGEAHTIATQMGEVFRAAGWPAPERATLDKVGSAMFLYELLATAVGEEAGYQISDACPSLIEVYPLAPRDEEKVEQLAKFDGDDPLDAERYGMYGKLRMKAPPMEVTLERKLLELEAHKGRPLSNTEKHLATMRFMETHKPRRSANLPGRFRPRSH